MKMSNSFKSSSSSFYGTRRMSGMMNMMFVFFFLCFIVAIVFIIMKYNNTKMIIQKYDCTPTDNATQEFDTDNNGGTSSTTKVFYQCKDHGRWLNSYDMLDAIFGQ